MDFKFKFLLIFLLFSISTHAQRTLKLTFDTGKEEKTVSYILRRGTVYASSKDLASAVSGNYYYNSNADKVEIKFSKYALKLTARNQYLVIRNLNSGMQQVYQIPISTLLINRDVFVPLEYALPYFEKASGKEINFDNGRKHLAFTGNRIENVSESTDVKKTIDPNSPFDIQAISIEEKTNGTLIRLSTKRKIHKFSSSINENKLFVFLSGVRVPPEIIKSIKPQGLVRSAQLKNVSGNVQLEFKLKQGYDNHESFVDPETGDIIITIHNKLFATPDERDIEKLAEKWKFDVIVIDAGHGGKDAGAIGVSGVKEKDVNLGIALKLGAMLKKKMPGVKIVYTRKTDKFVELYKRGKIANENDGKLFISIHCNSLRKKPSSTNGYEIYLLRPGRTKEAIKIAEFENSVIELEDNPKRYQKLTNENFILVSMAHSAFMRYSEKFAELLDKEYAKHTKVKSRGVKQAGFYVLVGASMPGILLETGFLSNRKDERYLKSSAGQKAIAKALTNAVLNYVKYYNDSINGES